MHWVERGPEPEGLEEIRARNTPRWVQYYTNGIGSRPTDSQWRQFHSDLEHSFRGLCAYCEETTKGEVDHFRPKSQFPSLVYSWSNWLFACHECNHRKSGNWPVGGYVDPCAISSSDRPELYFVFDTLTGFILPNRSLSPHRRQKAQTTIDDLRLNDLHHLKNRVEWIELFSAAIPADPDGLSDRTREILVHFASRETQLSSLILTWLSDHGYSMEIPESE